MWCERVLQHVDDADRALDELVRVTRPGGRLCLIDTDWASLAFDGVPADLARTVVADMHGRLMPRRLDMGRTLRRRLVARHLRQVTATPVTCLFDDPASAAVVLPMVNPTVPAGGLDDAARAYARSGSPSSTRPGRAATSWPC